MFTELPYQDMAGRWRCVWQMANGICLPLKFDHEPTEAECEAIEAQWLIDHQWDNDPTLTVQLMDNQDIIIDAVTQIRTHPGLTLAQYNNYLAAKPWYEASVIRYFIYKLSVWLANYYGVNLATMTETEVLLAVRNWICNQPLGRVKKVIFGMLNVEI